MSTITDRTDRDALLRYLDLCNDISDLINRYLDLPRATVHHTLIAKAHEIGAALHLPEKYQAPPASRGETEGEPQGASEAQHREEPNS